MGPIKAITAPPLVPSQYGLINSAPESPEPDDRWINGFSWDPETCSGGSLFPVCNPGPSPDSKTIGANPAIVTYQPHVAWAGDQCTTLTTERDRSARAARLLLACESSFIEAELWNGALTQDKSLDNAYLNSDDTDTDTVDATTNVVDALAGLEEARAQCHCGGRTMIHVPVGIAIKLFAARAIERSGNLLLTALNSIVVPGAGYGYDSNGDPDDGGPFMFASNMVYTKRGGIKTLGADPASEGVNRANNDWSVIAERPIAAFYDPCCTFGVSLAEA